MSKNTAHRPSQSNQQYVKNSRGEKVLNTAYQENHQLSHSSIENDNDFEYEKSFTVPLENINDQLTKNHKKNVDIVKKELSRYLNGDQKVEIIDSDDNSTYFSIGEDNTWGYPKKFYRLKNNTLERNVKIVNTWIANTSDDSWSVKPKNNLQEFTVLVNDTIVDNNIEEHYDIVENLGNNYSLVYDSGIQVDYEVNNVIKDNTNNKYYEINIKDSGWDFSLNNIYEVEPQSISIDKFEPKLNTELNYQSSRLNTLLENTVNGETEVYYDLPREDETDLEIIEVNSEDDPLSQLNPEGTGFNLNSSEGKQNDRYYSHGRIYHDKDTGEYLAVQFHSASEENGNLFSEIDIIKNDDGSYSSETGGLWKLEKTGETNTTIYKPVGK